MDSFTSVILWWPLLGFLCFALIFGLRSLLGTFRVRQDARSDYDYKKSQDMIPAGLNQDDYEQIYRRVYGPRSQTYLCLGALAVLVGTPIAFFILQRLLDLAYHLSGQSRTIEPGFLVWQFMIFFGLLITWGLIVFSVARLYHKRAPGNLQFEIDQHLFDEEDWAGFT